MTTYTTIADTDIDVDSPITTGLMTKMRDNPIAITEKASGSPVLANSYVVEAMLNASSVSQGKLKTTTGTVSAGSSAFTSVTLPGGEYGFFPLTRASIAGTGFGVIILDTTINPGTSATARICMKTPGSGTIYADQRYIQSSPPYDIGDGEINHFIFALINKQGEIQATYIAQDPPWANNGKTKVNPDYHINRNGKIIGMQKVRERAFTMEDVKSGKATMEQFAQLVEKDIEVTQAIKNADMVDIPHPFMNNDLTDLTPVLIDPYSQLAHDICLMQKDGENVTDIITNYVKIETQLNGLITPNGVQIVKARYK